MAAKKTAATKKATANKKATTTKYGAKTNLVPLKDKSTPKKENLVPLKDHTPSKKNLVPLKDESTPKKENLVPIKDRYVPLKEHNPKGHGVAKGAAAGFKDMRPGFGEHHTFARGNAVRYANGLNKIYK